MKKSIYLLLCISNIMYMGQLHARDEIVNASRERSYYWGTSDEGQKAVAVKMTLTGVFFFLAIGLLSGFCPDDPGSVTPFDTPDTANTLLK